MQGRRLLSVGLALAALAGASPWQTDADAAGEGVKDQGGGKSEAACLSDGRTDQPDGLDLAAKALGCEPRRVKPPFLRPPIQPSQPKRLLRRSRQRASSLRSRSGCFGGVGSRRRVGPPLDGVWEVRCAGGPVIWLHRIDGAWTVRPLG
jgi:hypothetical protein